MRQLREDMERVSGVSDEEKRAMLRGGGGWRRVQRRRGRKRVHGRARKGADASEGRLRFEAVHEELLDKRLLFFFFALVTGPRRSLSLRLSGTRVYEPQIRGHVRREGVFERSRQVRNR